MVNSLSRPVDPKTVTAPPIWMNFGATSTKELTVFFAAKAVVAPVVDQPMMAMMRATRASVLA